MAFVPELTQGEDHLVGPFEWITPVAHGAFLHCGILRPNSRAPAGRPCRGAAGARPDPCAVCLWRASRPPPRTARECWGWVPFAGMAEQPPGRAATRDDPVHVTS